MIEKIAYDYLSDNLNVPVFMEVPEHARCEFVVMEKVAGSITDHIRFATIAIQSYSSVSLYGAAQLNEDVHEVMDAMADHVDDVSECQMTADTNFTDTSTKRYRYQCLYNIYY
jgi:hypothetical protein